MVGRLLLLKMLHCRRLRRRKRNSKICNEHADVDQEPSKECAVKKEAIETEINTCRVCLRDGNIPIYGNYGYGDISEELGMFGGVEIHPDDGYPKYLCQACQDLLQGAILFRKTAQQSDQQLRHQPKFTADNDNNVTDNDNHLSDHDEDLDGLDVPFEYQGKTDEEQVDKYRCDRCGIDFVSFDDFSEHRLSVEHENMRHVCHICKKSYTSLYYKRHMSLHKADTTYMCDICGKKFNIQGQFTRHRLTHFLHLPFKCSLCPYRGRFTESLKMHMRSHTGEKPYHCAQCPSRFVNKSNLNKHMLTHKGDHDFKCEACGRGFYTKRDLELHFKVDHTGIKDHICNVCGKAFGYRKQMMKHQLKVHKREKLRSGRTPLYLQVALKEQQLEQGQIEA